MEWDYESANWIHPYKHHMQACIENGKIGSTRADPGVPGPSVVRKENCSCAYVRLGSTPVSLMWISSCALHGKGTDYYKNVFLPEQKADNNRLKELYKMRDEKRHVNFQEHS